MIVALFVKKEKKKKHYNYSHTNRWSSNSNTHTHTLLATTHSTLDSSDYRVVGDQSLHSSLSQPSAVSCGRRVSSWSPIFWIMADISWEREGWGRERERERDEVKQHRRSGETGYYFSNPIVCASNWSASFLNMRNWTSIHRTTLMTMASEINDTYKNDYDEHNGTICARYIASHHKYVT